MYTVSNSDMEYIKRFLALLCADTALCAAKDLRTINQLRMAGLLLKKLERKQPIDSELSTEKNK